MSEFHGIVTGRYAIRGDLLPLLDECYICLNHLSFIIKFCKLEWILVIIIYIILHICIFKLYIIYSNQNLGKKGILCSGLLSI